MTGLRNLPRDWREAEIAEVLQHLPNGKLLHQGKSPKCEKEASPDDATWGVLKTTAVQPGEFREEHNKRLPDHLDPDPSIEVTTGDLLITCAGPRSRCGIPCLVRSARPRLMLSGKMYRFRADESVVNPTFLELALLSPAAQQHIDRMKTGTSESGLNLTHSRFSRLPIPVPPLREQDQIVAVLEEELSRLGATLASIKTMRTKADQFRRSLLHDTFTGGSSGSAKGWEMSSLSEVLSHSIGGVWGDPPANSEVDVDVIRVTELRLHGVVDPSSAVCRSITERQLETRRLRAGDLILEKSGGGPNSPVGRVGMVPKLSKPSVCSNFMMLMRVNEKQVLPRFLHLYLVYFYSVGLTEPLQTASTNIRNIKTKEYLRIPVPLPSLAEQARIVDELEEHLSRLDSALAAADRSERRCGVLRRSLLHAAFTGTLTEDWRKTHG